MNSKKEGYIRLFIVLLVVFAGAILTAYLNSPQWGWIIGFYSCMIMNLIMKKKDAS